MRKKTNPNPEAMLNDYGSECQIVIQLAGEQAATPSRITVEAVAPAGLDDERVRLSVTAPGLTMTTAEATLLRDVLGAAIRLAAARRPQTVHVHCDHDD